MGIPKPTGQFAGQMLSPGGWPESDEDTFYDRARQYNLMLRKVTDVMDTTRQQQVEVFDGGVWSGGAAGAANGALGTNLNEMSTLQDYLATVVTWHRHIADLIVQAKSEIGNNVDGAQREIVIIENDQELEPEAREAAINALVRETHLANTSVVAEAAEQVLASRNWKPPHNALQDLLHQVTPPAPDVPTLAVPTPNAPAPAVPTPTPFEPTPANPYDPVAPGVPVTPITPTPFEPTPANPSDPLGPGVPVTPVDPGPPATPVLPAPPVIPVNPDHPATPVTPITPVKPTPVNPVTPVNPRPSPGPSPSPTPGPSPAPTPAPVHPTPGPSPSPAPTPVGPAPDQPRMPVDPGTPSTPTTPGAEPAHVKPAAATDVSTGHTGQPSGPSHRGDDTSSPAMTPAAAGAMPTAGRGSAAGPGSASASAGQSTSAAAASGAGSRAAGGRAPLGGAGKAPATATTRAASARTAPPARPAPPDRKDDVEKDKKEPADDVTALPSVPVSAARAARDAVAAASGAGGAKKDPLRLARRVAAALNAHDSGGDDDYGFFWITAVTTDGEIVVANSYGLAYIPEAVRLPAKVFMASADRAIPADEKARTATYPVLAVQGWAAFHDLKLRAVIGTAEQLANSDPGVAKIILESDDIPDSGKMVGRSRLEVVDPAATAALADTDDLHLVDLLGPAPVDEDAPADQRHMFWFELMKPMTSTATGREVAHLRAFHAYADHCRELALHRAYGAAEAGAQRQMVEEFLYWRHVAGLLDSALSAAT